jgi:hypothetical protein
MNGFGTGYLTDVGLAYFVRRISGLDTTNVSEIAFGTGNSGGVDSLALTVEYDRDESVAVTWDAVNEGPIFTSTHTIAAGADAQTFLEMGGFTSSDIMPFYYAAAISIGGGSPGDTTTCNLTLVFKDSSE